METLPLEIEVRDATGGADLVRINKVGPGGDFAVLLDAPPPPESGEARKATFVLESPGLETATREISILGGEVTDLGDFELSVSK